MPKLKKCDIIPFSGYFSTLRQLIGKDILPAMVLFLGDSLTRGNVGYTYIRFMKKRSFRNRGKNGDSTWGALQRLRRYRGQRWYSDVDVCVAALGVNDLLRPFLCGYSRLFRLLFGRVVERKRCAPEPEAFERVCRELIETLRDDGKRVIIVGLPMIQIEGFPMDRLRQYNDILRSLSEDAGFVDILAIQEAENTEARRDFNWGQTLLPRLGDILLMGFFPFTKELFSKLRRLEFTVDGVHLNQFSAKAIGTALDRLLDGEVEP